jgi:Spy/CpxP family protein refolding chaperone
MRKDMVVRRAELRALWRAENPDEKQILAKLKEINAVRAKLQEKVVPFRIEVKKILPKGPGPKGKLSMEDCDPNQEIITAMEFGCPGDAVL